MNSLLPISRITPKCWSLVLLFLSLILRLYTVLFILPIDIVWDSYHHWQISYLTLQIGLKYGRMWDYTGMEYFWGVLPHLVQGFLLWLFNTKSLLPFRIFNATLGSVSAVVLYRLCLKFFDTRVALLAAFLMIITPSFVIYTSLGVFEALGITLLLLSIFFYNDRFYLCGVMLGLASMVRIEYWLIAIGIIGCYLIFEKSLTKMLPSLAGWLTLMVPYWLFLRTQTGDWLYPLKWNFLASAGVWTTSPPLSVTWPWRTLWVSVLIVSLVFIRFFYKRKYPNYIIFIFFIGYLMFQGIVYGLTQRYEMGNLIDVVQERFYMLDHLFVVLLLSSVVRFPKFHLKPRRIQLYGCLLLLLFSLWLVATLQSRQQGVSSIKFWFEIGDWVSSHYVGGTVVNDMPVINYQLVNKGISCHNILGSLYIPDETSLAVRWLRNYNVTWFICTSDRSFILLDNFKELAPTVFTLEYSQGSIRVYHVSQFELSKFA